jgi:hypothetical protein
MDDPHSTTEPPIDAVAAIARLLVEHAEEQLANRR